MNKVTKNLLLFCGGTLFGSAGFRILSSKDARKVYTHTTAAVLRMREDVTDTVTCVQEHCSDILADAKEINAKRAAADECEEVADTCEE
ncbi:MAG: hypothetical protein E7423_10810 [Ruminococcaceae bacterium]|nr:hypothetical protein [Oscillospiraceae bacterium]